MNICNINNFKVATVCYSSVDADLGVESHVNSLCCFKQVGWNLVITAIDGSLEEFQGGSRP